ncbi:MAG TPA: DEAD/DEAH box helicase, partial [Phycisphaerales bacterium]|nr:DEAD/DEAH box helicase [Phycisphaerales bacterium]
ANPVAPPTPPNAPTPAPEPALPHPFAASHDQLRAALAPLLGDGPIHTGALTLVLPAHGAQPLPSPHIAHSHGQVAADADDDAEDIEAPAAPDAPDAPAEHHAPPTPVKFSVPTIVVSAADVPGALDAVEDAVASMDLGPASRAGAPGHIIAGESLRFFAAASRFVRHLLSQQRFVPMIQQEPSGAIAGVWQPWLADEATATRLARLQGAMPPSARAAADAFNHDGWSVLDDFLLRTGDALCRRVLVKDAMHEAIEGRDAQADLHVAWLSGLLGEVSGADVDARPGPRNDLIKGVRRWIGGLEERGSGAAWRLLLRLSEPLDVPGVGDVLAAPGDKVRWTLSLHLQNVVEPSVVADAADIWLLPPGAASVEGQRIEQPQELLLSELGRAARLYKRLEKVLEQAEPTELELTTSDAYKFLREFRPIMLEQGFGVVAPDWWDSPTVRLGARLLVQSEDVDLSTIGAAGGAGGAGGANAPQLGLSSLVSYRWQIAVGDTNLTLEQFEKLAAQHSPLVRLNGRWVEIRPEDVKAAIRFIRENPGGKMEVGRALRLAYASDTRDTGVPILGMDATGWVDAVFGGDPKSSVKMPMIEAPRGFVGTLRAYQLKGLSWLAFLDKLGLGACLADDMGLGKTIQLLALLAHERSCLGGPAPRAGSSGAPGLVDESPAGEAIPITPSNESQPTHTIPPTLLIVPMSVVSNWVHEAKRFTPSLRVLVHHGLDRLSGEKLVESARNSDMVITTYALAHRDRDHLSNVTWGRIVLDEAQNIKNPTAKQTRAIHSIPAPRRFALTGTPLENRLIELWSIMDFLNPGYLGPAGEFRSRFAVPIERYHDKHRGAQLRGLVQPFVLRRLKTDPTVITDLPEKVESKEYCYLTPEQAGLYQTCVADMLAAAERAEGIQRRGLVLAGLIKLKQICNHPAHFLKEFGAGGADGNAAHAPAINPARSGKCQRLVEMLQEVVAAGDKALVFTQFRQMSHLLATMLRQTLDRDVLLLHGGTPAAQRTQIIAEFQGDRARMSKVRAGNASNVTPPVLILSLKAGGVGLNLTAANHVFHFDRWWNPAVESQATDRAYRIGQTRTVQVHKFVVSGTLEERIDQMIQEKTDLADQIIGHGEQWLTELSTNQLRDLLTLRADAVEPDDDELDALGTPTLRGGSPGTPTLRGGPLADAQEALSIP